MQITTSHYVTVLGHHVTNKCLPRIAWHVLRKIRQKNRKIKSDLLCRVMESLGELDVVNFTVMISIATRQHEIHFFAEIMDVD